MVLDTKRFHEGLSHFFKVLEGHDWNLGQRSDAVHPLRLATLEKCFESLRSPIRQAQGARISNPWAVAGLGTDEVRVSAVLASLWDQRQYGNEARNFLQRFLLTIAEGPVRKVELDDNYRIQTEHCLNGNTSDRVDITIETQSAIIGVEVKIEASERKNQLPDYVAAIAKRAELMKRNTHAVVFLSPYASRDESHSVPHFSWRQLAEVAGDADQSTKSGWLICQFGSFCKSLGN